MIGQDDGWVRCPYCKHKLFRKTGNADFIPEFGDHADMECKCHSCKSVIGFIVVKDEK